MPLILQHRLYILRRTREKKMAARGASSPLCDGAGSPLPPDTFLKMKLPVLFLYALQFIWVHLFVPILHVCYNFILFLVVPFK